MTTDQFLTLLAICAWPTVALIAGVAFVHGVRLLVDAAVDYLETYQHWQKTRQTLDGEQFNINRSSYERLCRQCESSFLVILQANGGIPARQSDDAARSLVREIRKMYSEIDRPTPEPPIVDRGSGGSEPIHVTARDLDFDIGDMGDLEDVEEGEVYGS